MIRVLRPLLLGTAMLASAAFGQSSSDVTAPATTPAVTETPASAATAATPAVTALPSPIATGTLVMDIAPFTSEIVLKKKIQAQLESGGLEWGQQDDRIVMTMLNKRFVNFDIGKFTRYGTKTELQLPAGDYRITGIGFIPSTGFDVMKIVAKGAYFNVDVMTVRVEAGKVTTLAISPVIKKQNTFFVEVYMPDLVATTTLDGVTSEPVTLNAMTPNSVKLPYYSGDLKFQGSAAK